MFNHINFYVANFYLFDTQITGVNISTQLREKKIKIKLKQRKEEDYCMKNIFFFYTINFLPEEF